jgi:PIN domain nuclease of toxin-antitoxin system
MFCSGGRRTIRGLPGTRTRPFAAQRRCSSASRPAWEIAIGISAGKLSLAIVGQAGFALLPITIQHATEVARLLRHHRDPFDRMLVAQARHERLTLVTHDRRLSAYDVAILRT